MAGGEWRVVSGVWRVAGGDWGAATGPNTPGADTVGGNVETSGCLTEPILCRDFDVYLPAMLR